MIGIVTDSTCDLPENLIDEYGIIVVPHTIIWGDELYRDRVDMSPEEFYRRLTVDKRYPTTAQATVFDFQQAFEKAIGMGAGEIICLTVSSAMSGAYNMALNAAKLMKIPVHVIDSKGPTMTLGWQVLEVARNAAAGMDIPGILARVDAIRKRMVQLVCMDTIEYLQKGGRIGNAVKWVGVLLHVKPLVSINHITGLVEPVTLARTQKAVMEAMYTKFFEMLQGSKNLHVAVLHGNALEKAEALAARIKEEYNPVELLINITGPVLGVNTGPGALALCGYAEE